MVGEPEGGRDAGQTFVGGDYPIDCQAHPDIGPVSADAATGDRRERSAEMVRGYGEGVGEVTEQRGRVVCDQLTRLPHQTTSRRSDAMWLGPQGGLLETP
jgi:hypothetical protein